MAIHQDLFAYIEKSPTPFHAVAESARRLEQAGFAALNETENWSLVPGGKYYVTRNQSSLIAFVMPQTAGEGWRMSAAHSDSPSFKVKSASQQAGFTMLNTEGYGGMIRSAWLDRPLGIAGRVLVKTERGVESRLVNLEGVSAVIPHLAIHFDRTVNDGHKYDLKKDMQAIFAGPDKNACYTELLARAAGCTPAEILGTDLQLYCKDKGQTVGGEAEFLLCPRLDDLGCAWATLWGFLGAPASRQGRVWCLFDNEEVGSGTRQGACGSFLPDVLARAGQALGENEQDRRRALANSLLLSADNGHAIHPNFAEMSDAASPVKLNGGVVLKFNASQKYTTNGVTGALFHSLCDTAKVPVQEYYNRPDLPGGSTLGNLLGAQVSVPMADIGLPQLAMHSCVEMTGAQDVQWLADACAAWFRADVRCNGDGCYQVAL